MKDKINNIVKADINIPLSWVFTIFTLLLSLGVCYGTYKAKFEEAQEKITRLEGGQQTLADTLSKTNDRVGELTTAIVRLEERLKGLDKNLDRVASRDENNKGVLDKVVVEPLKKVF